EAYHPRERSDEEFEKLRTRLELAGCAEHRTEAAGLTGHLPQQQKAYRQHKRRSDALEKPDGVDAGPNDGHVQRPQEEEHSHWEEVCTAQAGHRIFDMAKIAWPPIQV
ncbi:MAG: hypothetical protein ACRD9L_12565, partial [Bryobacteraceae bacterium]